MSGKPRIGVTGHDRFFSPSWWCLSLALRLCRAKPVRISVRHIPEDDDFDAIIISGGNDISPEHYHGEINQQVKLDPERDKLEIEWIRKTLNQDIPLLGICRGAQLINVVLGGTLHEDISAMRRLTYNRPGLLPTKQVCIAPGSHAQVIFKKNRLRVNSLHHQAIKNVGSDLSVVGHDLDSITQIIESKKYRVMGVQWHPEYLLYLPSQLRLFHWLVQSSVSKSAL